MCTPSHIFLVLQGPVCVAIYFGEMLKSQLTTEKFLLGQSNPYFRRADPGLNPVYVLQGLIAQQLGDFSTPLSQIFPRAEITN